MRPCLRRPRRTPRSWKVPLVVPVSSDDLEIFEVLDDLLEALALVDDLLAGFAGRSGLDADDLLAGAGPPDVSGIDAEIGDGDLVDRFALGRHDPLERRVPRLDHTGGDRH